MSNLPKKRVAVVGVGRMGANMARRLNDCGYRVAAVYDVNTQAAAVLAQELGTTALDNLEEVSQAADVIFTVVTDDAAMRHIYTDAEHNLLQNATGKYFVNCATISPHVHQELHQLACACGAHMLEAPMASSIPQARDGSLFMMCAGERADFEALQPVLLDLTQNALFIGAPGTAAQLKALVNMVMNINTAGLAEGLGLADALGLDLDLVREVFAQTGASSRVLATDGPDMQHRDHETYFSAAHAAKDTHIALQLAQTQQLQLPLATATAAQYDAMLAHGLGALDKSGVSELTFKGRQPSLL